MKQRPKGFLSDKEDFHKSEIFDYIRELHGYLWRFIYAELGQVSGSLDNFIDNAIEKSEKEKKQKEVSMSIDWEKPIRVRETKAKAEVLCTDLKNPEYPIGIRFIAQDGVEQVESLTQSGKANYLYSDKPFVENIPEMIEGYLNIYQLMQENLVRIMKGSSPIRRFK